MIQKVYSFVEQYHMIDRGDHILAAVSGGADSVCLLLVLRALRERYGLRLTVIHVEHGIRGKDSLGDARFVQELCQGMQMDCRVEHRDAVAFSREQGMTLEEGARILRYQCFADARNELGADKIAVAHNKNDCGETLLFHLARGTGLKGMCGIVPVREDIIRPLLCVSRQEIEGFLEGRGQEYRTDTTNFETAYSRNKIRHQVLPVLTEINQGAVEHLYQSTRYAAEAVELVEELAARAKTECIVHRDGEILLLHTVREQPSVIQKTLVQHMLGECAGSRKDVSSVHVSEVLGLLEKQVGRRISLPYGLEARRTYEGIILRQSPAASSRSVVISQKGEYPETADMSSEPGQTAWESIPLKPGQPLFLPELGWQITSRLFQKMEEFHEIPQKTYTKWFDYDKIKGTLLLRKRGMEDYFVLDAQGRTQRLKKYFINEKVPQEERDRIPILADGAHVLWAMGYRISEAFKVTEETQRILEVQVNGGNIYE